MLDLSGHRSQQETEMSNIRENHEIWHVSTQKAIQEIRKHFNYWNYTYSLYDKCGHDLTSPSHIDEARETYSFRMQNFRAWVQEKTGTKLNQVSSSPTSYSVYIVANIFSHKE